MHCTRKLDERGLMGGVSPIIPGASAFVPVLADILVAVLLSWIDLTL
jgi:hypothetical protein